MSGDRQSEVTAEKVDVQTPEHNVDEELLSTILAGSSSNHTKLINYLRNKMNTLIMSSVNCLCEIFICYVEKIGPKPSRKQLMHTSTGG